MSGFCDCSPLVSQLLYYYASFILLGVILRYFIHTTFCCSAWYRHVLDFSTTLVAYCCEYAHVRLLGSTHGAAGFAMAVALVGAINAGLAYLAPGGTCGDTESPAPRKQPPRKSAKNSAKKRESENKEKRRSGGSSQQWQNGDEQDKDIDDADDDVEDDDDDSCEESRCTGGMCDTVCWLPPGCVPTSNPLTHLLSFLLGCTNRCCALKLLVERVLAHVLAAFLAQYLAETVWSHMFTSGGFGCGYIGQCESGGDVCCRYGAGLIFPVLFESIGTFMAVALVLGWGYTMDVGVTLCRLLLLLAMTILDAGCATPLFLNPIASVLTYHDRFCCCDFLESLLIHSLTPALCAVLASSIFIRYSASAGCVMKGCIKLSQKSPRAGPPKNRGQKAPSPPELQGDGIEWRPVEWLPRDGDSRPPPLLMLCMDSCDEEHAGFCNNSPTHGPPGVRFEPCCSLTCPLDAGCFPRVAPRFIKSPSICRKPCRPACCCMVRCSTGRHRSPYEQPNYSRGRHHRYDDKDDNKIKESQEESKEVEVRNNKTTSNISKEKEKRDHSKKKPKDGEKRSSRGERDSKGDSSHSIHSRSDKKKEKAREGHKESSSKGHGHDRSEKKRDGHKGNSSNESKEHGHNKQEKEKEEHKGSSSKGHRHDKREKEKEKEGHKGNSSNELKGHDHGKKEKEKENSPTNKTPNELDTRKKEKSSKGESGDHERKKESKDSHSSIVTSASDKGSVTSVSHDSRRSGDSSKRATKPSTHHSKKSTGSSNKSKNSSNLKR